MKTKTQIYRHHCDTCGYDAIDSEKLFVCPDCSSSEITNDDGNEENLEKEEYDDREYPGELEDYYRKVGD